MPMFNSALQLDNAIVIYDGISRPDPQEAKNGQPGGFKYTLKIAIPQGCPDHQLLEQLTNTELQNGVFKGVFPHNGYWTNRPTNPGEFNDLLPGYVVVNASTYRQPEMYDQNGQKIAPMQAGQVLYHGQLVDVLVNIKSYNNVSKGIKCELDGFRVHTNDNAPQMALGGGGGQAGQAFGQSSGHGPQAGQPQYGAPPQQQAPAQYGQPQQPQQPPAYGQPPQHSAPQQPQQPQYGARDPQQPQYGAPPQQPEQPQYSAPQQPQQHAPQQATNYLPQ